MAYEKCRRCQYACKCCNSHFMEIWPKCNSCSNNHREFEPSVHILYCPVDGQRIKRPLFDINGRLIMED